MDTKELAADFKESFLERVKNPFVLLYLISWCAWNWLLIYEVFSFPETYSLQTKVKIIENYISKQFWCNLTFWPLLSATIGAVVFIAASTLFLLLFSWFQRTVKPKIYKITAKDENIPRYLYEALHRRYDNLKSIFDDSKKTWIELEDKRIELNNHTAKLTSENQVLKNQEQISSEKLIELQEELSRYKMTPSEAFEVYKKTLANDKLWYLSNDVNSVTKYFILRFAADRNVYDEHNVLVYRVDNIEVLLGNQLIKFDLQDNNDLKKHRTHYLFKLDEKRLTGLEISPNNERAVISYSQNKLISPIPEISDKRKKELLVLERVFGNHEWKFMKLGTNYSENFKYQDGTFVIINSSSKSVKAGEVIEISDVYYLDGKLKFSKNNALRHYKNLVNELHVVSSAYLFGTERDSDVEYRRVKTN